jgi:hypothetical protein
MILLAALVRDRGYAFWNMRHPELAYKKAIGARIVPRNALLERWQAARDKLPTQALGGASGTTVLSGRQSSP